MQPDPVGGVPGWIVAGLGLGGAAALLVSVLFVLGERLFPTAVPTGTGREAGENRRRAEIRRFLDAVGEPYLEDHAVAGFEVAFFLPERGVAITFDARQYFLLEGAGIHPVLVEHEMPGDQIAGRLPFETPPVDLRGAARPAGPTAYEVLGLTPSADPEAVRAAYRRRVKEAHPDHGGDLETFARVREAYTAARERAG